MTSLDDASAFHHVLLRPSSWPLFGLSYGGIDYCWCVLPFGFSLILWCYHTLSEAKAAYLRSKGIPALAYLDDLWLSNFRASHGRAARAQWLAAGEATHVAMLISLLCGQFLSGKKCDFRPTRQPQFLGMCVTRTPLSSECRKRSWTSCSCCCEQPWTGDSYLSVSYSGSRASE